MSSLRWIAIALVVGCSSLAGCSVQTDTVPDAPTASEAQASFDTVWAGAQRTVEVGNWKRFCARESDDSSMCEMSIQDLSTRRTADPGSRKPAVTFELRDGALVGTAIGELADGTGYTTQLQFVRSDDGKIRPVDAVFWNSRTIVTGTDGEMSTGEDTSDAG